MKVAHVRLGLIARMAGSSQVVMLPWKMAAVTGADSCKVLLAWNSGVRLAMITTGPSEMGICRIGLWAQREIQR